MELRANLYISRISEKTLRVSIHMVKKEDVVDEQENDLMTKRKVIYLGYHKNFCWGLKINLGQSLATMASTLLFL